MIKEGKKVIEILDKKIRDMWTIYINGTDDENYIVFKTLKDDLNYFKQQRRKWRMNIIYVGFWKYF